MAVVISLNRFSAPVDDTVTAHPKTQVTSHKAWWLGLAPATLEFWVRFPNERNQGKQAHPVCVECLIGKQKKSFLFKVTVTVTFAKVCVFITAGPMIKLCAGGEGDSEGHVL